MKHKKRTVWVTGHKNPDTDSICSAIAYAYLKNQINPEYEYVPVRAGHRNEETHYVLDYFEVETPRYVTNVQTQVQDISYREMDLVPGDISLMKAWKMMRELSVMTLPIGYDHEIEGLITIGDIATAYMEVADSWVLSAAKTYYRNIVETLEGEMIVGDIDTRFESGKVMVAAANPNEVEKFIEPGDMVILGNRYEAQLCAIEMEAACLIITQGAEVSKTIQKLATERGCYVIVTPYDTFTASRLLNQSMPIEHFMVPTPLNTFKPEDTVGHVKETMAKLRHRYFPIVDDKGSFLGMLSKRNLLESMPKAVILVDHNEKSQALDGIEEAEILEIIDHHRLGSLETMQPVFFRNQPVGCTATIIYSMFVENQVEIPQKIAGLLCSAILSDTLMFRSPTCTSLDREACAMLAAIAGIQVETFASEMFHAASNYEERPVEDIFKQDLKKFALGDQKFEIGQISFLSDKDVEGLKERVLEHMQERIDNGLSEGIYFMMTNIVKERTDLLFKGEGTREIVEDAFHENTLEDSVMLPGVVSRKKQLVPQLMATMHQ
ncbi:MAG: putative manganese-dependent inorganic diphosphatase [Lachnospiraceae bacterium]|jgi:manganese-dependent inorganic pyrophosphatase|nr:putative manganese-dependent inorganic diphosphatase [Lachnospiraceae bacterium]